MKSNHQNGASVSVRIRLILGSKDLFTPSDFVTVNVTNVMLKNTMTTQHILPVIVPVKKIKGAARQRYVSRSV